MNLVLYSGGDETDNIELDTEAIALSGTYTPKVTYIPSCAYESEIEFHQFVKHYRSLGVNRFIHFPVDIHFDETLKREALNSDIIHLSGGNTYYFLKHLKKSGIFSELKKFVKRGGVLTGLSAGGIMMTPNIDTAGFPTFDKDDNDEGVTNFKALNLVSFEFFPHYRNSKRYDEELIAHSLKSKYPIYACSDGTGVAIEGHTVKFLGKCYIFENGKKFILRR